MKRLLSFRYSFFLLFLLLGLLLGQGVSAQVGDPEKVLKTEKQKKKPRKKKRKDPDHSQRDEVYKLVRPPKQVNHEPGAFTPKNKPKKEEQNPRPELNGDASLTEKVRKRQQSKGAVYQGDRKVKKKEKQAPGTHYSERSGKAAKQATRNSGTTYAGKEKVQGNFKDEATTSAGNIKIKRKDVQQPGEVYNAEDRLKKRKRREMGGTTSAGALSVKKKDIDQPGVVYNAEDRAKASKRRDPKGTTSAGNMRVKRKEIDQPGVVYNREDREKAARRQNLPGTVHAGSKTVKTKYVREPGVHWSERKSSFAKQYKSTVAASYAGNVAAMSKRERSRHYAQMSERINQHEGNVKVRKADADMHPSVVARKAATMRSAEQKDKARKRSRWYNRIFKNNDQPSSVRAKERKPRYDKGENEIWYE